jgi:hypothetical protein
VIAYIESPQKVVKVSKKSIPASKKGIPPLVMAKSKKFNHNIFLCLISRSHSEARIFSHHRQRKVLSLSLSHTHTHTHRTQLSRRNSTINIILCFISRSRSEARIFPHHRQTTFSLSFIGQLHSACYTHTQGSVSSTVRCKPPVCLPPPPNPHHSSIVTRWPQANSHGNSPYLAKPGEQQARW